MFISVLDLFKPGIGPSSSHTVGPMVAANLFRSLAEQLLGEKVERNTRLRLRVTLRGSLAHTGKGHGTDRALILGLNGYRPDELAQQDPDALVATLGKRTAIHLDDNRPLQFCPDQDLVFDYGPALAEHPNGMIFSVQDETGTVLMNETYFSIGGGFVTTKEEIRSVEAPLKLVQPNAFPYPFDTAQGMLDMAEDAGLSVADLKWANELKAIEGTSVTQRQLEQQIDRIWGAMETCIERGLKTEGRLPGGLGVERRAHALYRSCLEQPEQTQTADWLCAYAFAVNEENADGHPVVTAPTNGAAGVIPAVIYFFLKHEKGNPELIRAFLLTASAIGGLIKHKSSISGAEVGCQGEVGSAAAMAAAGLCEVKGGTPGQVENAAEIALEHHLGMTCDPVNGLVQVPCIERNGFGAVKAYTAASLALRGTGAHVMSLDKCIHAMKQTGMEMSDKFKETALGGLAQSWTEC